MPTAKTKAGMEIRTTVGEFPLEVQKFHLNPDVHIKVIVEESQAKASTTLDRNPGKLLAEYLKKNKPFKGQSEKIVKATHTIRESMGERF